MQKKKHTYLVNIEIITVDGNDTIYDSRQLKRTTNLGNVFDMGLSTADFIVKTILEHEQQED